MDLHRVGDTPDWANVPPAKRNMWQQMAADTQGVGTPGNALSVIGFALVVVGLCIVVTRSLWEGTLFVSAGRVADLVDGVIAQHTGTKSPLGRLLDAGLDKAGALLALLVFTLVKALPIEIAIAIAAQNLANVIISSYAPWRYTFLNPSYAGKVATAGYWLAIVTFVAAQLLHGNGTPFWHNCAEGIAYGISIVALILGVYASLGYMKVVRHAPHHRQKQEQYREV